MEMLAATEGRPRLIWAAGLGAAVGLALGVAGALLQAVSRNPLAEPGLLGVSAGAAFAVALAIVLGCERSLSNLAYLPTRDVADLGDSYGNLFSR